MKKIIMQLKEFLQFRQTCEMYRIKFDYWYKDGGEVTIRANEFDLNQIGY